MTWFCSLHPKTVISKETPPVAVPCWPANPCPVTSQFKRSLTPGSHQTKYTLFFFFETTFNFSFINTRPNRAAVHHGAPNAQWTSIPRCVVQAAQSSYNSEVILSNRQLCGLLNLQHIIFQRSPRYTTVTVITEKPSVKTDVFSLFQPSQILCRNTEMLQCD